MCTEEEKRQRRALKKSSSWRHQMSWRRQALEIPFDETTYEVFNNIFACSREPGEQSQVRLRQLLLWDWIQGKDGECIFGVALAKAMLSRVYRWHQPEYPPCDVRD
eukprot:2845329-Rhodomonas_salina.2